MTNELLIRIGKSYLRVVDATVALAVSEGSGAQRDQARLDRTTLSIAQRALDALVQEAKS